jgi:alpha-L-fucosidase
MEGKGRNDWESEELIKTARALQPDIIIDNRSDMEQDLWTPEQYQMLEWVKHAETGELVTWEACQTFSGSWGYFRDEQTWKTPKMLIDMLINTVCIGGNLLMNVGPTARGYLDYRAENALKVYADWMKYNSRSIYGCTMAEPEFKAPRGTRLTQSEDGKRLYIHLIEYPYAFLEFENLADKIDYAQFLNDGSEVLYTKGGVDHFSEARSQKEGLVAFKIPAIQPNTLVPVIEVFLK